ncbi:MAG: hypothetical protein HY400_06025 [Elusimicrobia bacterium]|nr:hypothetical protein [Elusimicrobiota bacterium]
MKLILWEIWTYLQVPVIWYLFRRFAQRNVKGEIIAGTLLGIYIEFSTEPLWQYHFQINVYKDIPLSILASWGVMFTLVSFVSEKLYCRLLKKNEIEPYDKRILLFDMLGGGLLVGFPSEIIGIYTGIWEYRYDRLNWDWGNVPFLDMPYESLVAYSLLMLIAPTFVRYWQEAFEKKK